MNCLVHNQGSSTDWGLVVRPNKPVLRLKVKPRARTLGDTKAHTQKVKSKVGARGKEMKTKPPVSSNLCLLSRDDSELRSAVTELLATYSGQEGPTSQH